MSTFCIVVENGKLGATKGVVEEGKLGPTRGVVKKGKLGPTRGPIFLVSAVREKGELGQTRVVVEKGELGPKKGVVEKGKLGPTRGVVEKWKLGPTRGVGKRQAAFDKGCRGRRHGDDGDSNDDVDGGGDEMQDGIYKDDVGEYDNDADYGDALMKTISMRLVMGSFDVSDDVDDEGDDIREGWMMRRESDAHDQSAKKSRFCFGRDALVVCSP